MRFPGPMLCQAGPLPADADAGAWALEVKWDGARTLAHVRDGQARLLTRAGNDSTHRYPELHGLGAGLPDGTILDGELICLGPDGKPDFGALQRRLHRDRPPVGLAAVHYRCFDVPRIGARDLCAEPYERRRELLERLDLGSEHADVPAVLHGPPSAVWAAVCEHGLEGVVAKRLTGPYLPGRRSAHWRKTKATCQQEFVVGGVLMGTGARARQLGALLVGVHDEHGLLRYAGSVGSGFTHADLARYATLLPGLVTERSPFAGRHPRGAFHVRPVLCVQVAYLEWRRGGMLRQPVYRGAAEHVDAASVTRRGPVLAGRQLTAARS